MKLHLNQQCWIIYKIAFQVRTVIKPKSPSDTGCGSLRIRKIGLRYHLLRVELKVFYIPALKFVSQFPNHFTITQMQA
jgi:hypothetical protein